RKRSKIRKSTMKKIFVLVALLFHTVAWSKIEIGKPAPDFSLKGVDGRTYKLSELKGKKVVVLVWFNNGCPYVRKHYDSGNMQRLQKKYAGSEVSWFTIASSAKGKEGHIKNADEGTKLRESRKMGNTALLLDDGSSVARDYGAKTTPHMFVIDKNG